MDSDWMERLKEAVMDERQSVSYKWASATLRVHVNVAKQILFAFAEQNPDVDVIYLLAGDDRSGVKRICLVSKSDLDSAKSRLSRITSLHVHSVSLNSENHMENAFNLDAKRINDQPFLSSFSSIKNRDAVRTFSKAKEEEGEGEGEEGGVKKVVKEKVEISKREVIKAPSRIAGMFIAGSSKKMKQNDTTKDEKNSPGKENRINEEKERERKRDVKKQKVTSSSSMKRKRIQVASDSDSSENEEIIPDEPPPPQATLVESDDEVIPATPRPENGVKKRKVGKLVTKNFVDEDGFLVTKKEYEACSEEEEEEVKPVIKEPVSQVSKKSKAKESIVKSKQPTIMAFFKK